MRIETFSDIRESIRKYNSNSVLRVGTDECWRIWSSGWSNSIDWINGNIRRNHAIRLMLLASAGVSIQVLLTA